MAGNLVSIVMPTYRHSLLLPMSINSILNQTYENIELVIVSVREDKETTNYLSNAKLDSRINWIISDVADSCKQINQGITASKGEYVTFISSDDYTLPNRIKAEVRTAEENEALVVYSPFFIGDENLNIVSRVELHEKMTYDLLTARPSSCIPDVCLTWKTVYDEFGLLDETLGNDGGFFWDKWIRVIEKYPDKIVYCPYPTWIYRQHSQQTGKRESEEVRSKYMASRLRVLAESRKRAGR